MQELENADQTRTSSDPATKHRTLIARLRSLGSVVVAFSGGADSAYLAWSAHQALGEFALAVTAVSPSFPARDRKHVVAFARAYALRHEFLETHEFENPLYLLNQPDRCYHCKEELFSKLAQLRAARKFAAIAYGINADDVRDFRPGHRAASEFGVLAPLLDAGLTKTEIRELSRREGLTTWDRPASACLSSRIPYGIPVTTDILTRVDLAEGFLRELGFRQIRVRAHGELARIEISREELPLAFHLEIAREIAQRIREIGFAYVTLDLDGYRQGSLNAALGSKEK